MPSTGIYAMKKIFIFVARHFERQENTMPYSEYWNPKNETLPREELRALQFLKLRRSCDWAWERSAFHRRLWERGKFHPGQLKSLDDIRRIPFMTREDWMDAQAGHPPFGNLTT